MNVTTLQDLQKHIPLVGDVNVKSPLAYQVTRGAVEVVNTVQMAAAEAYINGLEVPDTVLRSLFDATIPIIYKHFPSFLVAYDWILKESEQLAEGSRELMKIQYDLPKAMFGLMLGEGKLIYPKYTMALWEKGALNLEQAQMQMLDDVIEKVGIKDGDEILDLGCGWGSASHYILAKFPNSKVTALNLSHEQCEYMRNKMQDSESYLSSGRFTLCEKDFNEAKFETKFDKIIAIGLFEHIGNLTRSFKNLASFLKDDGKIFIHIITICLPHNATNPFIQQYIFPNMRVWSYETIPNCNQDLKTLDKWYMNGLNYTKTLRSWLNNFDENQEEIQTLNYGMNYQKFRRIWRLYLLWCIAYFESCNGEILGNGQYLMTHA
ncbi:MAG: class I SAM-dependent methyltransferase [Coleofasciculaceae cyanobacterium]|jgi:cyclopropane-fatty-acyl-phospholipid synthase